MNENLEFAKKRLENNNLTLALYNGINCIESKERGLRPLLDLLDQNEDYSAYAAADKVVGRAAAFLYVQLGIKKIHSGIISSKAAEVFRNNEIEFFSDKEVPYIINRAGNGMCPMENAVLELNDSVEAEKVIRQKILDMQKKNS